ncbi:unnamed protein product [Gulo gulo]|uniref:UBC core domain-containing protein n=1 Tax=Gulo gulo TaxID=48420 RepID=A0A9X9MDP4_GULGU|nr:unnamed protein product [Gulo gulo]
MEQLTPYMKTCIISSPWSSQVAPLPMPMVKFLTSCYYPNVKTQRNICLDTLKDKRSAGYDVRTILLSIQSLLGEPNIGSPLNTHTAELWKNPHSL